MVTRMNRDCAAWKVSVQDTHRLLLLIGHPHRPQLPRPMQPRQHQRIPPVRLHPLLTATGARTGGPRPAAVPVPEAPGSTHFRVSWLQFSVPRVRRVVRAVEVQPLVLARRSLVDASNRSTGKDRVERPPISSEFLVHLPHRERAIPEIDEHPDSVALSERGVRSSHLTPYKATRTHEASLGSA